MIVSISHVIISINSKKLKMIDVLHVFPAVVYVRFHQSSYWVNESDSANICLELFGAAGNTGSPIWVSVSTNDSSAVGGFICSVCVSATLCHSRFVKAMFASESGGTDYIPAVNSTVSFPSGSGNGSKACIIIPIPNDLIFEKSKYFLLHIIKAERNVHIYPPRYVPIHIHDDDGKY